MTKVESMNIFFNQTTSSTQLMQGDILWRGVHEKDPLSLQFLIVMLTKPKMWFWRLMLLHVRFSSLNAFKCYVLNFESYICE